MSPQPPRSPDSGKPGSPLRNQILVFRQPFILGRHPTVSELAGHMLSLGWAPHREPSLGETVELLTWKKGTYLATDVRPENALVSEATGTVHPIDFIVAGKEIA